MNATRPPENFTSARLWGIAIADSRVPGYESAEVEVASTSSSCRIEGKDIVLNDDAGTLSGGLYQRIPWFSTDSHDPIPLAYDLPHHSVVLRVGQRVDRIWHFWSPSPRAALPASSLEGCTVHARVRISSGALLQMGMDYWRSPTVPFGAGGNNREAGASNWYFSSSQWQDASLATSAALSSENWSESNGRSPSDAFAKLLRPPVLARMKLDAAVHRTIRCSRCRRRTRRVRGRHGRGPHGSAGPRSTL